MELGNYQYPSVTIREVLLNPGWNPGYLCLPPDIESWTLDTIGKLSLDSLYLPPDSKDSLPPEVLEEGWVETLDGADIRGIVIVAKRELINPTPEQLLEAFKYYYVYDAFMMYSEDF